MHDDQRPGVDRRALLRRMAAGGAVVWASPMLHTAAAGQAVGSCGSTPRTLDWDTLPLGGPFSSAVVGGVTVSVSAAPAAGTTVPASNPEVDNSTSGGVSGNHLHFQMNSNAPGREQVIVFTFSAPVTNLVIPVYDIDADNDIVTSYLDQVIVNTAGHTSFVPTGSNVIGTGSSGDPYRNSVTNISVQAASNDGNLVLQHPGPTTSFQLTYRNGNQFGGFFPLQWIDVGDITFTC